MLTKKPSKKKDKKGIVPKRELFCRYYSQNRSLFGNGALSYAAAYGYDLDNMSKDDAVIDKTGKVVKKSSYDLAFNVCSTEASKLLTIPMIDERVTKLINEYVTANVADRELSMVILQNRDLRAKVAAIKEYNNVAGRITTKVKHKFEGVSDEALAERAAELIAGTLRDNGGAGDEEE